MDINTLLDFTEELLNMPGSFFARTARAKEVSSQKTWEKSDLEICEEVASI